MRRILVVIFILLLCGACSHLILNLAQPTPELAVSSLSPAFTFTPQPTATIAPTSTPTALLPTFTTTPQPSSSLTPLPPSFTVLFHPDDMLYVGDQVSMEVVSPPGLDLKEASVRVQVDPPDGPQFGPVNFGSWGIQGRQEATLLWVWDTSHASPGMHTLSFSVQPQNYTWTEQATLLPASALPENQANAKWATTQTDCCTVYYITNTAADRDLPTLSTLIDKQASDAIDKMGASFTEPITITLLPRLLGHGGFTSSEISVSYLDRDYAANSWAMVIHHEMIHAIDGHLGGEFRPTIFVEGLAVYLTGGHYKPEPLMPRTSALLPQYLNWYIPLKPLANDFYASQHEIGYMEGASLIEYMVNTYGFPAFSSFYRDMHNKQGQSQSDSIDEALQKHFSISFSQLEQNYLAALAAQPEAASWVDDVRLTVTYFDTMRRYQQLLDPSAYFRTTWLLDNKTMRERGIVADYLRHPHTPVNLALETLFLTASHQLAVKDYSASAQTIADINLVLDAIEHGTDDPFSVAPITADYLALVSTISQLGYEVQNIELAGDVAQATVTSPTSTGLILLNLHRSGAEWFITP